ncbi:efflux RND transporter permease subunit [Leptolyngbya sp. FACHB-321]|uniref:efflux RND transporter permease subunit n=1 Tax=Leptolyngbya sp. FACHB-321 TaxID=2692807 RepID=UPI001684AD3A|nr:efflux RND transporter permease subunit [Leptolyngbya sp. FACHB-321]MBD2038727.1 efflux RND transporter permease subunit [Leptolyngbya sp. FACHB-321]
MSLRERFNISRLAIQYPWLTLGFWIAVCVAGLLAFSSLKYALFPDVTFPVVVVNATASIPTAQETEARLTQPIEETLQPLEAQGLNSVRSSTYPGRSIVSLSFAVGTDLDESVARVETELKKLKLPDNSTYKITPVNLNESAVVSYAIENPKQTLAQLTTLAQERILPTIAQVPGVLKVNLLGVPAGATVTTPTAKPNVAEQAVLNAGSSAVRFGGRDALALEVVKRGDANTLDVVKAVDNAVVQLRSQLPEVQVNLAATQAEYIREATDSTVEALGLAIILSVIVIFPFLWDWKATLISALAIPTSLFGTFIVMALFGFNLETITLLALALVVGIIVDDAIVDVENIARHLDEGGKSPRQAAIEATDEIGLTVAAATLTIAAVFLPVAFMRGVVGQFFQPFGVTVSAAVLISLLVARTLSPLLAVYWLRPRPQKPSEQGLSGFVNAYRKLLQWSLRHRAIVIGIALLSFVAGLALIPIIPKGFIPKLDRGEFNITYTAPLPAIALNQAALAQAAQAQAAGVKPTTLPPGVDPALLAAAQKAPPINPLQDSLETAKKLEAVVLQSPEVESVFTTVGTRQQPNKGTLYVKLREGHTVSTTALQDQFRQQLPVLKNVTTSIEDIQFVDTGGDKPLQVGLIGDDPLVLSQSAKTIKERLEKLPGFADVTTTGAANTADRIVEIERRNARRVAYVSANLGENIALGDATDRAVAIANEVKPPSISLNLGGDSARLGEIFGSFGFTLGLAVICVLAVLVLLFRSWTDPLAIIFSLPLSIVGALLAALLTRSDFGMISIIGIIFLLGLVNKSAILLVDYTNQLRRSGLSRSEAILTAAPVRLRPILMTTAATILGMLPIALGLGAGAELRAPMAIAIIGGLITSTLLSLIVVPVVYALLDDLRLRLKGKREN